MMHRLSSGDHHIPLVADASVIINLVASGMPEKIIPALSNPVVVVEEILVELERGRRTGCRDADVLRGLIDGGVVSCVSLGENEWETFEELICGHASTTLDDGEAATLAYCVERSSIPVIDERKANSICRKRYSSLSPKASVDLFRMAGSNEEIGNDALSDAVYQALKIGRMRVMDHHIDWVVDLIGRERAVTCRSLSKKVRTMCRQT